MSEPAAGRYGFSLRWRLMVIGATGLSVALFLGSWLLLIALGWAFDRSADASARRTQADVAALVASGLLSQPVPVAGVQLVQVVDRQDRVRAGSQGVDRLVPILQPAELAQALLGQHLKIDGDRVGLSEPLRVSAAAAGPSSDPLAVVVAVPLGEDREAIGTLRIALIVLFFPIIGALAVIAWWVIGRSLGPVEALRAGAEEITGRRRADAERLPVPAGADEIHRLAVTLNGMLERLAAARKRQRQFVADAAHELRNPLASMRTQLEVARRHPEATDWAEFTEDLLHDTGQLAALADNLLLLAGADETDAVIRRPSAVSVCEMLAGLVIRYRDARVAVRLRGAADANADAGGAGDGEGAGDGDGEGAGDGDGEGAGDLRVRADPEDLQRVMTNLLDNAVRHARSRVWLAAGCDQDRIRIVVTDDGPGIPEADRERVFERFTRLDDARTIDEGGAGLGLAIVAELVARQDGTIHLTSAAPGLQVELSFPHFPRDQVPSDLRFP